MKNRGNAGGACGQKTGPQRKGIAVGEKSKKRALRHCRKRHNVAKTLRKCHHCSRSAFCARPKNGGEERVGGGRPGAPTPAGRATAETVARIPDGHEPTMGASIATGCGGAAPCKRLGQCRGNGTIGLAGNGKTKRKEAGGEPGAGLSRRPGETQTQIGVPTETADALKKARASAEIR